MCPGFFSVSALCASVLGSILPVIIALSFGFETVLFLAAILYSVSLLAAWKSC
jgi:hypothetical protein